MYIWTLIFVGFLCRLCGIIETPHDRSRPGVLYGLTVLDDLGPFSRSQESEN